MYLSRLILNAHSRRVQRELAEPYEMHRTIMSAYLRELAAGEERVLFRVDRQPATEVPVLLIQSRTLPDWSCLSRQGAHDYVLSVDGPNPAVKPLVLDLLAGQVLAFRLRANPTIKKSHENDQTGQGRRHALVHVEEQRAWLERKGEACGFHVLSANIACESYVGGTIHRAEDTQDLNLFAVRYDGVLQVQEAERLAMAVQQGIGSGKAFGFGLLSLAPARLG